MNKALSLLNKKSFWLVTAALMALALGSTIVFFKNNNPLLILAIKMNRTQALKDAHVLAEKYQWPAYQGHTAITFQEEQTVQFFVELEGGGKEAFAQLMKTKEYEPYTWHVRYFEEQKTEESHVFFTPDGTPYGFTVKLAETTERPNLSVHEARELAQAVATHQWTVDFSQWKEVEASKEVKPCKRVDHAFVYQKIDKKIGDQGEFRLRLVVSGDMVTEVKRSVFIPEAFTRRFEKMRSSNTIVATLGSTGFFLLYLILGCLIAGTFFFRKQLLIIRPACYWALGFGVLFFMTAFNKLSLAWMNYKTTSSFETFLMNYSFSTLASACAIGLGFTFLFSVCLTWDRLAFPNHLQFWNLWSKNMGASSTVLHLTFLGCAWAVIFLGMANFIYYLLTSVVGWWGPAETITDPNTIATYFPWLQSFYQSLQAGFFEEVVFRALPLSAACLIGRYVKREHLFIIGGLLLQALIFSACHADYPQMPGIFRLVELFIPALIFGILYLFFGLIPVIIAHFLYDFFLMALPVLIEDSYHAWISKGMIVLLALFPLLFVWYRRSQRGSWYTPHSEDFNPPFAIESLFKKDESLHQTIPDQSQKSVTHSIISPLTKKIIYGAGALGLIAWATCSRFTPNTAAITISKKDTVIFAQEIFKEQGFSPCLPWTTLPFIAALTSLPEKFVWQTQGKKVYEQLLTSYLTPPLWAVRFASFSGDVIQRAEEFVVLIGPEGTVFRTLTILPESQSGASLVQGQARGVALTALEEQYTLTTEHLKEISAVEQKKPARLDWTFIFQDTRETLKEGGQARISVSIAGDKVVNITRFIFIPEDWQREEQKKETHKNLINFMLIMLLAGIFIFTFIRSQKILFSSFCLKTTCLTALALFVFSGLHFFNQLVSLEALTFKTSSSYVSQLLHLCSMNLFMILISSCAIGLILAHIKNSIRSRAHLAFGQAVLLGMSVQFMFLGVSGLFLHFTKHYMPTIPDYSPLGCFSSFFANLVFITQTHLYGLVMLVVLFSGIAVITQKGTQRFFLGNFLIFLFGFATGYMFFCQVAYPGTALAFAFVNGFLWSILYHVLLRYDDTLIFIKIVTAASCTALYNGILQPYPSALAQGVCISVLIFLTGLFFFYSLRLKKDIL